MCLALGFSHPEELEDNLSPRQISDWEAYYRAEPFGFEFVNAVTARLAWASLQANSKKRLDESDYVLRFEPKPRPTIEEYRSKSMRAYIGHGGRIGAT